MMEITIKISDINYAAAIDVLAPVLADKLSGWAKPVADLAFGKAKNLSVTAAKAALKALPPNVRDELAAVCLNYYNKEISRVIANIANRQNVSLKVQSIEAASMNEPQRPPPQNSNTLKHFAKI